MPEEQEPFIGEDGKVATNDDFGPDQWDGWGPRRKAAISPALGWRPISTAPKDGRLVVLYERGHGYAIGYWVGGRWKIDGDWDVAFTHYMPLPAPPEAP